ncbi:MAG TPA: hypothetical protein VJ327_01995, partial [Patescibacteria group bacterium]|nr:hypothetical protein [Patescibacteria group bacterium]
MKPIPFPCPYGRKTHNAYAHSRTHVLCSIHGVLLYTDIPPEIVRLLKRKSRGWKTIAEVTNEHREMLKRMITSLLHKSLK